MEINEAAPCCCYKKCNNTEELYKLTAEQDVIARQQPLGLKNEANADVPKTAVP